MFDKSTFANSASAATIPITRSPTSACFHLAGPLVEELHTKQANLQRELFLIESYPLGEIGHCLSVRFGIHLSHSLLMKFMMSDPSR